MEETTTICEFPFGVDAHSGALMTFRKAWDNGGKTFDRYTITFDIYSVETGKWEPWKETLTHFGCLGASERPFNPQGFGQSCQCQEGRHLGRRIKFSALPDDVQRFVKQFLAGH